MIFEFRLPNMQQGQDEKQQLQYIKNFLFQHIQQLNLAMAELSKQETGESAADQKTQTGDSPGRLFRRVKEQMRKEFLGKDKFNAYFRVGLLGQEEYGVEIGRTVTREEEKVFLPAARLMPGKTVFFDEDGNQVAAIADGALEMGSYTISERNGHLTIQ